MWFKHRAWIPIAWGLSLINVGATWFAARPGEATHAAVHALLAAAFALGAQHLAARGRPAEPSEDLKQALDQNEELQRRHASVRWGIVLVCLAVGFALIEFFGWDDVTPGAIAVLLGATGVGNLVSFAVSRNLPR